MAALVATRRIFASLLFGCGLIATAASPFENAPLKPNTSQIQHVVIIIQENRSFDNLFNGYPGADTAQSGPTHSGKIVQLSPVPLEAPWDLGHDHPTWVISYNGGQMNGFDLTWKPRGISPTANYAYVPHSEIQPYLQMAQQYTLSDTMFQANTSGSFASHLYLVAAWTQYLIGAPNQRPWGCDAPPGTRARQFLPNGQIGGAGVFPCLSFKTLADEADAAGVTWHFYAPALTAPNNIWNTLDAFRSIRYGPDWTNDVISPETTVLTDIANGYLANITWVVPTGANSDHPGMRSNTGPQWVASIVNAIGASPYWNSTAIFIVWDDWGGWYEHVKPVKLDVMGLGFRVPLLVVSPYAQQGYVSHVHHEWGSILHFTEEVFGLPSLGQSDARADDLADCFNFGQQPRSFKPIPTRLPPSYFLRQPHTIDAPDNDF
jgi:phospholipase C